MNEKLIKKLSIKKEPEIKINKLKLFKKRNQIKTLKK